MSYPQSPQQMPPSGNGNRGNGNPFKRNSPSDPNGNQKGNNSGGPQPFWKSPWLWGVLLVVMAVAGFQLFAGAGTQTIDTKDGFALLKTENVAYAKIIDNKQLVQLELKSNFTKTDPDTNKPHNYGKKVQFYYTFAQGAQVVQAVEKADPSKGWTSNMQQTSMVSYLISSILPFIIMIAVFWFLMSRMGGASGMFGMGGKKNNGKLLEGQTPSTKFSDVAGEDSAVQEVEEIKDFLKDPSKYKALGARIPRGVLLYGPPGTGKTLLARAIAGEAGVPFYAMAGSDFVEMFVGLGASRVRDLFDEAKKNAPAIIFIDEIDAVGRKRGSGMSGGHDEREQTLNQLLTEMDGFDATKGVVILAATNRPESLDPALTRPGRFDRRVPVELPDLKGRESILRLHAKKVKLGPDCDFGVVARMTPGASGAELANIVNEAALCAVRHRRKAVTQFDLQEAVDTILAGAQKKNKILNNKEKCIVSYHEVGHALVAALQTNSAPVQKITIVPRTSGALGFTMQVEDGDHTLMTKEEILNKIATLTGGRAAEELIFHSITTGASNDIEQATKLARALVTRYGMTEDFDMVALETVNNAYLGGDASLACSEQTAAQVDAKVVEIVQAEHKKAYQLLADNKRKLDEIAQYLYEKETISGEEFMRILNAQPQLPAGPSADSTNQAQ